MLPFLERESKIIIHMLTAQNEDILITAFYVKWYHI